MNEGSTLLNQSAISCQHFLGRLLAQGRWGSASIYVASLEAENPERKWRETVTKMEGGALRRLTNVPRGGMLPEARRARPSNLFAFEMGEC
jgi:hypothetical protein